MIVFPSQLTLDLPTPDQCSTLVVDQKKICRDCGEAKPLSHFGKEMGTPNLKKTACKICLGKNKKGAMRAKKYLGDAPPLGYECLCGKVYNGGPRGRIWVPDHDHRTGNPRYWLCRECNTNFGKIKDNPNTLVKQLIYLLKHGVSYDRTLLNLYLASVHDLLEENELQFSYNNLTI